jgi:hypothetical protein
MAELKVKYANSNDQDGFDLGLLGESFSGLNVVLKDFGELMAIDGDVEVRTTKIEHGSIEIFNNLYITFTGLPFNSPQDLLDFLQVASPEMHKEAKEFLSGTLGMRNTLNDYFQNHAFDAILLAELGKVFMIKTWKWAGKQKTNLTTRDAELGEISNRKATRLKGMVGSGKFRKVLTPIAQGSVKSITLSSATENGDIKATINEKAIENYLPEEDQVLPHFTNGSEHVMNGVVKNLQSARGEIIKIKVDGLDKRYNLITAKPSDGKATDDYLNFYHQRVTFSAEVVRASMYKRPDFVIKSMEIAQQELIEDETE